MSTFNYSLNQLNDSKTYTHIQLPVKNDTSNGKIGLIQDIDIGVMQGFGYTIDGYNSDTSQINNFVSFVSTVDLLFKNLTNRITDLKTIVDGLTSESLIASIITEPKANSLTYNGTSQYLITAGSANNGVMYYSSAYDGSYSTSLPQGTNAGAYTVYYYAKGNSGYKDSAKSQLAVTIAKASSLKTAPTVKSAVISHDGSLHDLINAGTTNSGTMEYGVNFNNSSTTNPPSLWTSDIPQGQDSGQYYIWYRIQNGIDSNYEAINATYLTYVTISASAVQQYTVRLRIIYGSSITTEDKVVNSGSSATWTMEPPTGYNWPTTIENGRINGNTITSDVVTESNTDENGILTVTVTCVEATIAVTGIKLYPTSLELDANGTTTIRATIEPPNATNQTVNWQSSNPTVATVTSSTTSGNNATVTWKKAGSCTITATADGDASKSATCSVTCKEVAIQQYTVRLRIIYGSSITTEDKVVNSGSSATWTMEPPTGYNWPTTIENGRINGNTITSDVVTESNTDENGILTVTVTCVEATIAVTGIQLDPISLTVAGGSTASIMATVEPTNAANKTINWKSSDTTVATVATPTTSGNSTTVTWNKEGSCTITATSADNTSISKTCSVTCEEARVTKISLTPSSLELDANGTTTISATVSPSYATNQAIYWESSDTSVATVTTHTMSGNNATITWQGPGTCDITAKADNGRISKKCSVTCKSATIAITGIQLDPTSLTVAANDTNHIYATILPSNATNKTINWASSDTTVATVTSSTTSGKYATVTWKKVGECTITATAAGNTSISRTCQVICNAATIAVTGISLDNTTPISLAANGSKTITATILPPNATNQQINWQSSNTAVATVTPSTTSGNSATVTWAGAGTCTITAISADNTSKTATCTVNCASPTNNYYIGRSQKEVFTLDDLDQYVAEKPSEITLPGGDSKTTWAVWIYPESWGKPTKAISEYNNVDELASFNYNQLTFPEGYTGCWASPYIDNKYTLEW